MKYNRAEIMKSAWEIRKTGGVTMSEAMKTAWGVAKIKVGANPMDDAVQEYFQRLEAADKAMKALEKIKAEIQVACLESPDFCAFPGSAGTPATRNGNPLRTNTTYRRPIMRPLPERRTCGSCPTRKPPT